MRVPLTAPWLWLVASWLGACLVACGGGLTVHGEVVRPARVPVRAFPRIVVTTTDGGASDPLADTLAGHLEDRSEVRRAGARQVLAMRARGQLGPGSVVVSLASLIDARSVPVWARRDDLECGPPGGCVDLRRAYYDEIPEVRAAVVVTVAEGPSGRVLQRLELTEHESGQDVLAIRLRLFERLALRLRDLVDQRTENVPVLLLTLDAPEVREALDAIRGGDWTRGRERLEGFVASAALGSLPAPLRARALYDLGQARRFDPSVPPAERLAAARRAVLAAIRTDPQEHYARTLADIEHDVRNLAIVDAQERAREHNFELATAPAPSRRAPATPTPAQSSRRGLDVPEPPPSYRR